MNNKNIFIVLGLVASVTVAHAATKPKKQKQKTVADVLTQFKETDNRGKNQKLNKYSLIFPTAKENQPKAPARNMKAVKPPSTVSFFMDQNQTEGQLERLLDEQISELYKINRKFSKSPERGELWLRLGELYVEKAKLLSFRAHDEYDKKIQEWDAKGQKGARPRFDSAQGKEFNRKAIELYNWYVKDFPNSNKTDQALFFLGYNYFEINQPTRGTEFYEELTRRFSKSKYVTESHFALAEYYFDNDDWKKALINYRNVIGDKQSRVYPFALYKMAWCNYRLGQVNLAIQTMEQVISFSKRQARLGAKGDKQVNKIRLSKEAYNDLILYFVDVRSFKDAREYFGRIGGEKILFPTLEKLAYIYSDRGQREAARYIFRQLLEINPMAPKAFDYQYQIVLNYWSAGNRKTFRQELYDWVVDYGKDSDWAKENKDRLAESDALREKTLREYVLQLHQTAQKTATLMTQKQAKSGYELYISQFPKMEMIGDMRFYYGDLLFDMNLFEDASEQLRWVIRHAPKNANYKTALLNNILAIERLLPKEQDLMKMRGDTLQAFPLTEREKEFEGNAILFFNQFAKDPQMIEIKFRLGRMYYNHNDFDRALVVFKEIVKDHPTSNVAVFSANLILDIYNLRKDYDNLAKAGNQFLTTQGLNTKLIDLDVKNVVEKAKFKKAEDLEVNKDYIGSAKEFETFIKDYPTSKLVPTAQYNAAINYERGGQVLSAIRLYSGVLSKSGPEAEKVKKESRRLLGGLYNKTGQLRKAATEFERYAHDYPTDPLSTNLLYNAAVIWGAQQSFSRAITDYEKHIATTKKADSRLAAVYNMAELNEQRGSISKANQLFEQYLVSGATDHQKIVETHFRIAKNYKRLGQIPKYEEWLRKTISVQRRLGSKVGAREAAEAKFTFTAKLYDDIRSIKISGTPQNQAANLKRKLAVIDQLNKELAQIITLDVGDYIVAALATLGLSYENLANSIYRAPIPGGLTVEEKKEYLEKVVEANAAPFKKIAMDNFTNAVSKARELEFYNEWVVIARDGLARMNKASRPVKEEVLEDFQIDLMGL